MTRTQKDGKKIEVGALTVVQVYNQHMDGVDKGDMLRSLQEIDRKSKKYWYRLFYAMMEICLVNSYISYCELKGKVSFFDFKRRTTLGLFTCGKQIPNKRGRLKSDKNVLPQQASKRRKSAPVP